MQASFINLSVFLTTPLKALSLSLYLKMRLIMMLPFRCPHLFAKPLCIPQAPAITHIGLCSIALHTFYWVNTGPFLSVHRRGPMLYKSVNAILPLYLGDFFASSPNVTPHLVVFLLLCERVVWWQISFPRIYYLLCILQFSHNDPICI